MTLRGPSAFDRALALLLTWAVPGSSAWALTPLSAPSLRPNTALVTSEPLAATVDDRAKDRKDDREDDHDDHGDDDTLRPILECVVRHSHNSYTAYFGYKNETNKSITVPVGSKNSFSPSPQNRNQPTVFQKGRSPHYPNAAFSVPFSGSSLTWSLRGPNSETKAVTARSSSNRCEATPNPTPTPTPTATPNPIPTPTPPATCGNPVLTERRYTRTSGVCNGHGHGRHDRDDDDNGPTVYTQTFTLPAGWVGPYALRVVNGDAQGRNKTSSAEVRINGVLVVGPSDFSQNVTTFTKTIAALQASNQIYVKVSGAPGSTFTIGICGADPGDTVPPSVNWISPLEGELSSDPSPLLRVRYTDLVSNPNPATLQILIDGVDQTSLFNRQPDEASLDGLVTLFDGTHTLRAEIQDQAGNLGAATRTFRTDATSPSLLIATPSGGAMLSDARPQIRLTFADAGNEPSGVLPTSFAVSLDGVDITSALTRTATEAAGLPPTALTSGPHQLAATIADVAGNTTTVTSGFHVDTVPPVVTTVSPTANQVLGSATVAVAALYSDNHELNLDTFRGTIDGVAVSMVVDADSASGSMSGLVDGPHLLTLSIADRAGNVRSTTAAFRTDTGGPQIAVVTPPNGVLLNLLNPELLVTFEDGQGLDLSSLTIRVNGADRTADFTRTPAEARATLAEALPEGVNTITAEIRDQASNLGAASSSFTLDITAPTVTVRAPVANAFINDATPDVQIDLADSLTGVEPTATRIFVDDVDVTADFSIGPTLAAGTLSNTLNEGPHTLRVVTADRAANPTVVEVVFVIDLTAPTLDMASPREGSFTNDSTPEIWLRTADPIPASGIGPAAGVSSASIRLFLLSTDPAVPDTDLTSLLTIDASEARGEFVTALSDGTHRLRAVARDHAGNETEITVGFVVDTTAPTVVIDQPQSGTFLPTAEPTIALLYSDERSGIDPDLTQVKVDGIEHAASLTLTATGATLTLASVLGLSLADGPHQIEARVVDRAGNAMESAPVTFGVDTVAPAAEIVAPAAGSFVGSATPSIQFTLRDAAPSSGINTEFVRVFLDGVDITASITFATSGGAGTEPLVVTGTGTVPTPLSGGVHTLRLTAIDNANSPVEVISQFTVDTTAPVLTSDIPVEGLLIGASAIADGRATLTGTVSDLDPDLALTCSSPTGAGTISLSSGTYSCSVPVAEGANAISVTATDSSGHTSTLTRTLTVDRVAPVIVISDPTEGTFTSALSLSVSGTLTDASLAAGITVSVNGQAATVNASGGGPSTFETTGVAVGVGPNSAIEVVATDAAGNTATATVTVRVDRTAPVVVITEPASGAYLRGGVTSVSVDVTDETSTILDLNGVPGTKTVCVPATAGAERCTFTADIPLISGTAVVVATAFDEAGNQGVTQVSAIVDNTPPVITVTLPEAGLVTNAASISVTGSVADDSPVTLMVNGQSVTVALGGSFSATMSNDVLGVPLSGLEGTRQIVFIATDAAGNEATTSVSVTFDRTPPALSIASPLQGGVIPAATVAVSGTVSDATAVSVTVQGVAASLTGQAYSYTLSDAVEGPLTITVRAVDAAGNETTVVREVEIDLGPPTVAVTSPAAGTLTREATVLLAYAVLDRSATSITLNGAPVAPTCPGVLACDRTQTVDLGDGDNTFTVEATDAGGRTAAAVVTITRDSNAPSVELLAPETASRGRVATASVAAVDNLAMASVEVRVAGAVGSSVLCSGTSSCSGPIVLPEEARPGDSLTLTATATDTAGNVTTTSRTVRVTSDGVVTGTVLNDLTSLPLAGATVTLLGPNTRSTTTNEQGRYNIPVVEISAILRIEKTGMTSVDRAVSVNSGTGTVLVDARLTPLAETTSHTPVIPGLNPPAVIRPGSASEEMGTPGPVSLAAEGAQRVTLLSAQGLPNLLPPGFSPLTAFNWMPDNASASARVTVAMPTGTASLPETVLVRYDTAMRDWRVVAFGLLATDGAIGVDLVGPGSYALVIPDAPRTAPVAQGQAYALGAALVAALSPDGSPVTVVSIPATATSEGRVDPPVLPPTGGTATGLLRIDSPTPLPSGTIVQADLEETYTLASGEEASAPKRSMDIVAYKHAALATAWGTGENAGTISGATNSTACAPSMPPATGGAVEHLCAAFPITPSRTYSNASLREGRVKLDLLAGRENARGVVGGSEAMSVVAGNVQLNVAAGSLAEDTAIALWSYDDYSPFIPSTNGITPLGEVTVDFASSTLNTSASLTFRNVAAVPGDTLVVARVDRAAYDGIPRLQVVALADVIFANDETNAVTRVDTGLLGLALEGVKKEGRYTLLRLAGPIGFLTGSTTASGSPVRPVVTTDSLPFVATSNGAGVYAIPAVPGATTLTARVLGQSLIGTAQATAADGAPVTVNIALEGTVSQATITPASGSVGIEVNDLLSLTSPVALDPTTVTAANIVLRRVPPAACSEPTPPSTLDCAATQIPLRFVLSASGKQLSMLPAAAVPEPVGGAPAGAVPESDGGLPAGAVPESDGGLSVEGSALAFSTTYALEITGLLDTVGGLVTAPITTFRTKDDIKPVYNLQALTFSFPDADGLVTVSAPSGTFPPGTEILIINSGNGVVVGFTAGNDGQVSGTIPASTSDTLLVTVTDPFGNATSYESSKFVDPATGQTAIGPGGGTIEGPEGTAIHIPEGALFQGVAFKLDVLTPEQYDQQFPNQRPAFGDRPVGTVLKISAAQPGTFHRPVKLTFNVPGNFATTHPGADPRDAVFYALKRSTLPGGAVGFEIVDHAFAVCPGDAPGGDLPARDDPANPTCDATELSVKTASPPHPELTGNFLADTYILLTYDWDSAGARTALAGAVVGRVRRQAWGGGQQAGQVLYEPVEGAVVSGSDAEGNPLQSGNRLIAISQKDGTYTLWDSAYQGGTVTVHALAGNETATGIGFEGNPQDVSASWGPFQTLRFYQNKAHVDVVFEAQAPPPPTPDVDIVVMRDDDGVDTRGLSAAGVPLRIGFKNNRQGESVTIGSLDINGANFTVTTDTSGKFAGITQNVWTPAQPGTYILTTTALSPIGGSIPLSTTVRIVAAGGNIDTDQTQPPRVVDQQTYPKRGAKNVQTSIFPTIAFSEPVVNITHSTVQLTRVDSSAAGPVLPAPIADAIKISGVTVANQVIDDVTTAPTLPFTSITIRPLHGLKYRHQYTLSLTDGIRDLDTTEGAPSPKSLVPYATTFDTFGPESIPPDGEPASTTTTGFYVAKNANGEPLSMWSLKHQIIGSNWQALLTGYDVTDPINVVEATSLGILGRPIDLAGEGTLIAVATAPGVKSLPSNVRLYDVTNPEAPLWVGAASLAKTLGEGTVNRITLRGDRVYAGSFRKGIQILEVGAMRSALPACCSVEHFKAISDLNLDQKGFNEAAIITTIPVPGPGGQLSFFTGIKSIAQSAEPLIIATGNFGLALARESSPGSTVYRGMPTKDGETLQYGLALDVANVNGYDLAVVAGVSSTKQVLMIVDVSNPQLPVVRSVREIVADGRGVVDVLVNGTIVYVSTQKTTAPPSLGVEVFDISDPDTLAHLGRIDGVGGRLSIVGKLLYGATSGTFGAPIDGAGGVRTAALHTLIVLDRLRPSPVVVDPLNNAAEVIAVGYRIVPADPEVVQGQAVVRSNNTEVLALPASFNEGVGTVSLPIGVRILQTDVRVVADAQEGDTITSVWRRLEGRGTLVNPELPVALSVDQRRLTATLYSDAHLSRALRSPDTPPSTMIFEVLGSGGTLLNPSDTRIGGMFQASLAIGNTSGQVFRVAGRLPGSPTVAQTAEITLVPGEASQVSLAVARGALPADETSTTTVTLEARDQFGNLVSDGTRILWRATEGSIEPAESVTVAGLATATYRAGRVAGDQTIQAEVDGAVAVAAISLAGLSLSISATPSSILANAMFPIEINVGSAAGPPAPGSNLFVQGVLGRAAIVSDLTNGVAHFVFTASGHRGTGRIVATIGAVREERTFEVDPPAGVSSYLASPSIVADQVADGAVTIERVDGESVTYGYRTSTNLVVSGQPGEIVDVRLGSHRAPNIEPIAWYPMDDPTSQGAIDAYEDHQGTFEGPVVNDLIRKVTGSGSYKFSGQSRVVVPAHTALELAAPFGVAASFFADSATSGFLIGTEDPEIGTEDSFSLRLEPSGAAVKVVARLATEAGPLVLESAPVGLGAWHHVAFHVVDGVIRLVVDDDVREAPALSPIIPRAGPLVFGEGLVGNLDDVQIFDFSRPSLFALPNGSSEMAVEIGPQGTANVLIHSLGNLRTSSPHAWTVAIQSKIRGVAGETSSFLVAFSVELLVSILTAIDGFVLGDPEAVEAYAGELVSSFVLYGDVRDLSVALYRHWKATATTADYIVLTIAVVGLVTTVFPPADAVATGAKIGAKLLRRLPENAQRFIGEYAVQAIRDYFRGKKAKLFEFARFLNNLPGAIGALVRIAPSIRSVDDAGRLIRLGAKSADQVLLFNRVASAVEAITPAALRNQRTAELLQVVGRHGDDPRALVNGLAPVWAENAMKGVNRFLNVPGANLDKANAVVDVALLGRTAESFHPRVAEQFFESLQRMPSPAPGLDEFLKKKVSGLLAIRGVYGSSRLIAEAPELAQTGGKTIETIGDLVDYTKADQEGVDAILRLRDRLPREVQFGGRPPSDAVPEFFEIKYVSSLDSAIKTAQVRKHLVTRVADTANQLVAAGVRGSLLQNSMARVRLRFTIILRNAQGQSVDQLRDKAAADLNDVISGADDRFLILKEIGYRFSREDITIRLGDPIVDAEWAGLLR